MNFAAIAGISVAIFGFSALSSCGKGHAGDTAYADTLTTWPDTLRVATLYSPTSYFLYRDEPMGYDYNLVQDLCESKGMALNLQVAPRLEKAIDWLDSGKVDLVAYQVPMTDQYKKLVDYCGPETENYQVLVQPAGDSALTDVTQLAGKDVFVMEGSKYEQRLKNLNSELGGGIRLHPVRRDSIIAEDLLEMVASGKIPLTVVDSDIAKLNKTYYPSLDISMQLSFGQKSSWAVAPKNKALADSINSWMDTKAEQEFEAETFRRYFELSKNNYTGVGANHKFANGVMSPYDHLFRKYAKEIGWDWRLLAAQGYVESRYNPNAVSWAGARGVMQIMPGTARHNGFSPAQMSNPEMSIKAAVKVIAAFDKMMQPYVKDPRERQRFVLAAYNGGGAHILDAIALAKKTGRQPDKWFGNVERALKLKADPRYYRLPIVRYGYFRGRETIEYVKQIEEFYARAKQHVPA